MQCKKRIEVKDLFGTDKQSRELPSDKYFIVSNFDSFALSLSFQQHPDSGLESLIKRYPCKSEIDVLDKCLNDS